ncbi:MAG: hypothetical protein GEV07_16410 [Streptosporangiales bacterium]|nr:hypothetical protein [Streptosporangiales bacterium]
MTGLPPEIGRLAVPGFLAFAVVSATLLGPVSEASHAAERAPVSAGDLVIDTVVGTGDVGNTGDGGRARSAGLREPMDVTTGSDGTLYVLAGQQVRAVDPKTKDITTIAGTGKSGFSGDGGPAKKATFSGYENSYPANGLAVGSDGTVYVADTGNHRIRAIDPDDGTIRTVAGSGRGEEGGFSGDGGKATRARLQNPKDVAVDADGNLYIADSENSRVRLVDADTGKISTIGRSDTYVSTDGIAVHPSGRVYVSDQTGNQVLVVDRQKKTMEPVAGRGTSAAEVQGPTGLAFSRDGKALYVAGTDPFAEYPGKARIFRLELATNKVRTYAGGGAAEALGDGGRPTDAYLGEQLSSSTRGVAMGPAGELYLTDSRNLRVRSVRKARHPVRDDDRLAGQRIDSLVGSGKRTSAEDFGDNEDGPFERGAHALDDVDLQSPSDVVVADDGTMYLADTGNDMIRMVDPDDGVVRTLAGRPDYRPYDEDGDGDGGKATKAYLEDPRALALGPDDRLYFANETSDETMIRYVDLDDGTIDTLRGSRYEFTAPTGLAFDGKGDLYVLDADAQRLCRLELDADECVTVVADDPGSGPGAETERFVSPTALAIGPGGALLVANGNQILRVDKRTGQVSTFAGYVFGRSVEGGGGSAYSASFGYIADMSVADGTLYLTDKANHRVRAIDLKQHVVRRVAGTGKLREGGGSDGAINGGGDFTGDGKPAGKAELNEPSAVAVGPDGELYIVDSSNRRVRVIGETEITPGIVVHPLVTIAVITVLLIAAAIVLRVWWRRRKHQPTGAGAA